MSFVVSVEFVPEMFLPGVCCLKSWQALIGHEVSTELSLMDTSGVNCNLATLAAIALASCTCNWRDARSVVCVAYILTQSDLSHARRCWFFLRIAVLIQYCDGRPGGKPPSLSVGLR